MCGTCGCSDDGETVMHDVQSGVREHIHTDSSAKSEVIAVERALLARNAEIAHANRHWLADRGILALNVLGSPGSGKTTLLERTLEAAAPRGGTPVFVLEGDQATANDAERVRAAGGRAVQINTGVACHLDAEMVRRGLAQLDPPRGALVLIENVGNLVCPALFDLGERARVVVASVTEGEDKPLKYPHMFRVADRVLLNKVDLLPHIRFDPEAFAAALEQVQPRVAPQLVSTIDGKGLETWVAWIRELQAAVATEVPHEH